MRIVRASDGEARLHASLHREITDERFDVPAVGRTSTLRRGAGRRIGFGLSRGRLLQSGQRLGPYEIVERIGAGGMGEVYRARDTRLSRHVAIKVLRGALRDDTRLRARFDREAKVISSLSDPHICALHDIGSHNGVDYLVLEYCDGITLAQRLDRGPLTIEQVLQYGNEIAKALSRAHRAGAQSLCRRSAHPLLLAVPLHGGAAV